MLKSLSSAISGLRSQQTEMDIIGNNIANVSTSGFRSSNANFEDLFYDTLNEGSQAVNPSQVGYGAQVGSIDKNMERVGANQTDRALDVYIDGDAYFGVCKDSKSTSPDYYTRVGDLHVGQDGYLEDSNGNYILGADLSASPIQSGSPINIQNAVKIKEDDGTTVTLNDNGKYLSKNLSISINPDGTITGSVDDAKGTLQDANGNSIQIALYTFPNQDGLSQVGDSYFTTSDSSGAATCVTAENGNNMSLRTGELDASNVDLAKEFTNMIVTERAYQSNSRIITTSDTMLQELLNMSKG